MQKFKVDLETVIQCVFCLKDIDSREKYMQIKLFIVNGMPVYPEGAEWMFSNGKFCHWNCFELPKENKNA